MDSTVLSSWRNVKNSSAQATILVLSLLFALLIGATTYILVTEYENTVSEAKEKTRNAVGAVSEHANWILQASKQALLRGDAAIGDPKNRSTWQVNDLRPLSAGLPPGARVFVVDKDGFSIPIKSNDTAMDISERDYFQGLVQGGNWFVGRQIVTKENGATVFTVAKRLVRDGYFAGIIGIAIPAEWMTRFYENLEFGSRSKVWLTTTDGWIVASAPIIDGNLSISQFPAWQTIQKNPSTFTEVDAKSFDGNQYYLASRKLEEAPLIATIALAKSEANLAFYKRLKFIAIAGAMGFFLLFALAIWVVILQRKDYRIRRDLADALSNKAESEANMRLAINAGRLGHWHIDPPHWNVTLSEHISSLIGLSPDERTMPLAEALAFVAKEDRERIGAEIRQTIETGRRFSSEYQIVRRDGQKRWMAAQGNLLCDADGHMIRIIGVVQDITDRKQFEDRQRLMIAELDHRVKNALATVQSLARQGLPKGDTTNAFVGRIGSLANAHSLLAESKWKGTAIKTLVMRQLGAHLGSNVIRVKYSGPDLLLRPKATQGLSMVLHELTTNAVKYGALASNESKLDIYWEIKPGADGPRLILQWRESDVPHVVTNHHKGFGSRLIEQSIKHELGGIIDTQFRPSGFSCLIDLPLEEVEMLNMEAGPASGEAVSHAPQEIESLSGKKILLVEDTVFVAMDMEERLLENGAAEVVSSFKLSDAIRQANEADYDLALLDVNIDGKMVFPVADILHRRGIPFLFLSGYGEDADWPEKWAHITLVSKPVQDTELFSAITRLLSYGEKSSMEKACV